ncbi:MAG: hypothetical protein LBH06_07360 [Rikenellaceae bacterium]|nr:hypothetical protein [Rikenellaceae bacterium]
MNLYAERYGDDFERSFKEFFRTGEGSLNSYKLEPNPVIFEMDPASNNYPFDYYNRPMSFADLYNFLALYSSEKIVRRLLHSSTSYLHPKLPRFWGFVDRYNAPDF